MLIISRKAEEVFTIGEDVEICILDILSDRVKIGIRAPRDVKIMRKELLETERANLQAALSGGDVDENAFSELLFK
jgi:carbon storage regulator